MNPGPRILLYLASAWLAAVFDTGISPLLAIGGCAPSACLLAASLCISIQQSRYAFLGSALFGLVSDLTGTDRLGLTMACFAFTGYALGRLQASAGRSGRIMLLLAATVAMAALTGLSHRCLDFTQSIGIGLYSGVCAASLLLIAGPRMKDC